MIVFVTALSATLLIARSSTASDMQMILKPGDDLFGAFLLTLTSAGAFFLLVTAKIFQPFFDKHGKKIFIYGSVAVVALCVAVIISMYMKNRSLWIDEAILAVNIVMRDWKELFTPPLDYGVSPPGVLYLAALKMSGSIFGYSEFSMRLFSLLSYLGFLTTLAFVLRKILNADIYKTAAFVVIAALSPIFIWHSNEAKPYMGDAFFAILTILFYALYLQKKIKLPTFTALCILIMGFSTPGIFFAGGVMLCEFIAAAAHKDKKRVLHISAAGAVAVAIFALYFKWWYSPADIEHWQAFFNTNRSVATVMREITKIFNPETFTSLRGKSDSTFIWLFVPFAVVGIIFAVRSRNKIICAIALSLFFAILASAINYWPLIARLWMFLPAFVFVLAPFGLGVITKNRKNVSKIAVSALYGFAVPLVINVFSYTDADKVFLVAQEVNPLIEYVRENIREGEMVYVYHNAVPVFKFKNYRSPTRIGNVSHDNVILSIVDVSMLGNNHPEWSTGGLVLMEDGETYMLGDELTSIVSHERVYMIFSHYWKRGVERGLDILQQLGTLILVKEIHHEQQLVMFERKRAGE